MMEKNSKKKKSLYLLMVVLGLPLSIMAATSQNIIHGIIFGSVLAFGIDGLFSSIQCKQKAF